MHAKIVSVIQSENNIVVSVEFRAQKADKDSLTTRQYSFSSDATKAQMRQSVQDDLSRLKTVATKVSALQDLVGAEFAN